MKRKTVLLEGTPIFGNRTGVGQYVFNLFSALFEIDHRNSYLVYAYLFIGKKLANPFKRPPKNVHFRLVRYIPSKIVNVISRKISPMPMDLLTFTKPDTILFSNFVRGPVITKARTITIIYDLSFISHKKYANAKNAELLSKQVPISVKKSDIIVTISANSKNEIIKEYGASPDKIKVINPAIDQKIFYPRKKVEIASVKRKYKIEGDYLLYTGTLEPRKNIIGILESYSLLPQNIRDRYGLILAGGKGWLDDGIHSKLKELHGLNIITTGYVDDEDLPALYSGATVFIYPSFYEGFGMPPLEAMACGAPVVTSNNSSLPEVVGDAGIMVDVDGTKDLTNAIRRVLLDKNLQQKMKKAGILRAKQFSWTKSANKLLEIL